MPKARGMLKYTVQVDGHGFNVPDGAYVTAARVGGRSIGEDMRTFVAAYPPATEANKPGRTKEVTRNVTRSYTPKKGLFRGGYTYNEDVARTVKLGWYERGVGWHYPSGTLAKGKRSQRLGTKWQVTETPSQAGSTVLVTNSAGYADVVHGKKQAQFHQKRKWKQIFTVMRSRKRKEWIDKANRLVLQLLRGWK